MIKITNYYAKNVCELVKGKWVKIQRILLTLIKMARAFDQKFEFSNKLYTLLHELHYPGGGQEQGVMVPTFLFFGS